MIPSGSSVRPGQSSNTPAARSYAQTVPASSASARAISDCLQNSIDKLISTRYRRDMNSTAPRAQIEHADFLLVACGQNRSSDHLTINRAFTLCNRSAGPQINGSPALANCKPCRVAARRILGGCPCAICRHS